MFYTPPWMQMFGPVINRWQGQADESQAQADRPRGLFGGIPGGFLGHLSGRNIFGRRIVPVEPGTHMLAQAVPEEEMLPRPEEEEKQRFMRRTSTAPQKSGMVRGRALGY